MTLQPVATQTTAATQAQQAKPEPTTAEAPAAKTAAGKAQADRVTISKQATLMNSPGYSAAEEATESPAAKAAEKSKGQR